MSTSPSASTSSIERRRTQLREAQRKHRQRQQDVTQELDLRVTELQERVRQSEKDKAVLQALALKSLSALETQRRLFVSELPRIIERSLSAQYHSRIHTRLAAPTNVVAECRGECTHRSDHRPQGAVRDVMTRRMPHEARTGSGSICDRSAYTTPISTPTPCTPDATSTLASSYFALDALEKASDGESSGAKRCGSAFELDEIAARRHQLQSTFQLSDAEMEVLQSFCSAPRSNTTSDEGYFANSRAEELSLDLNWDNLGSYGKLLPTNIGDEDTLMASGDHSILNGTGGLYY